VGAEDVEARELRYRAEEMTSVPGCQCPVISCWLTNPILVSNVA
jgi:hypothetical protein